MTIERFWLLLSVVSVAVCVAASVSAEVIDFGSSAVALTLPYTEDGLTLYNLPGTHMAVIVHGDDRHLSGFSGFPMFPPVYIRAAGPKPLNLTSLDVEGFSGTWRIQSSEGASMILSGAGTFNFANKTGWSNIDYFDVIHDPVERPNVISIDNITFEFVPEPSSHIIFAVSMLGLMLRRRR
jgi:hypothetical protein